MSTSNVAIVGAGIAGLACARYLSQLNPAPALTIFEKSRSLSGRCATKTNFHSLQDHGAPYFTMSSPTVRDALHPLLTEELRVIPPEAIVDVNGRPVSKSTGPYYYCVSGNAAVGAALARDLDVQHHALVTEVRSDASVRVRMRADDGEEERVMSFDVVVVTAPLPQTCKLLNAPPEIAAEWTDAFEPCLTALLWYDMQKVEASSRLHAALKGEIYAVAADDVFTTCENYKQGRSRADGAACVMVQAGPIFSEEHLGADAKLWMDLLQRRAAELWRLPTEALTDTFAKKWRYARARPGRRSKVRGWTAGRVIVSGDGVEGISTVEGAYLQGIQAARRVTSLGPQILPPNNDM